ncbi:T9SS type A sorting domain-containing protein [Winogradskyella helgolandensis]|uniref:T9SS type A sorting domain-containing protein n=1 Tax=Winogradskyella helgolandensis TaxID=2697010 RepID=UPI0015CBD353|nr:T9SS type A sorting domain-containing protein [Winogradskyella helgolandensis]
MKNVLRLFILIPFFSFGQIQIGEAIFSDTDNDQFGRSIDLSSDGNILAVGAVYNNGNGSHSGSVKLYENQSGVWIQVGDDIYGDLPNDFLGLSVSLNFDGSIVAIGITGAGNDGNGFSSGAVKIYSNQLGVWTQLGQTIFGESYNDNLGRYVNLNSVGNIVAVTSILHNGSKGQVRIFENQSDVWTQIGSEIEGEEYNDELGWTVELNSEGNIIAVGARNSDGINGGINVGIVRIYENISNVWTQIGQDIEGESDYDQSGVRLSLSADGNIVAISAPTNDGNGENSGHVRVYENVSGVWTQIGTDIDGQNIYYRFGSSLDLSADGSTLAIGSGSIYENGSNSGQVKIYQNQLDVWTQIGSSINGDDLNQGFGYKLSLSADGTTVAISSLNTSGTNTWFGSASIYDLSLLLSTEDKTLNGFNIYPNPTKNQFTIQLENNKELQNVTIYNNLGQQVLTSKKSVIDTSKLASGLYVVEIETNKGKGSKKLIVE